MRTNKLIASIITMMIAFFMFTQSASAFERVADECVSCHKQVVVDKVAKVALKVTVDAKTERQTESAIVLATKQVITDKRITSSIVIADYRTGFKSRPGWQA